MHTCIYIHIYIYIHTYIHTYTHTHTNMCVYIYIYIYILGYILELETEDLEQSSRRPCHTTAFLLLYYCITDCFTTADRGPGAEYTPPL